jgi:acyl-CoA synthetase (AMP-forming)/AMP-acid ligase II
MTAPPHSYNLADLWEAVADAVPDREALVVGAERRSYRQLEDRANRLANHLASRGVAAGGHVALYLENCPEYLEAMLAAFKLRAVPINVNHRYVAGELRYLLDDSDAVAVVTQPSLAATVTTVVAELPDVRFTLVTGADYEAALAAADATRSQGPRSSDDFYIMYTGGTTGLPKGVVWRHEDAFFACVGGGDTAGLQPPVTSPGQLLERISETPLCFMPLAPMMHAAAQWTSLARLLAGDKVVLMSGSLDPAAAWRTIEAEAVQVLTTVGDAVARPLLDEWDCSGTYDASSLMVFANGGAPLSPQARQRVRDLLPGVVLADGFGSSEAGTQVSSLVSPTGKAQAAGPVRFDRPRKPTLVIGPDGREVAPGSGEVGTVLAGGHLPLGYYNDPAKTAELFVERDGQRWLATGDMATVAADGAIELRGRASGVINTGGEKVFPEEVESVLVAHPAVADCLVVGVPDDRWGSAVAAVVQPVPQAEPALTDLVVHCKAQLAGYKAPKHLVLVERIVRSPSGKADYRWAKATVADVLGEQSAAADAER